MRPAKSASSAITAGLRCVPESGNGYAHSNQISLTLTVRPDSPFRMKTEPALRRVNREPLRQRGEY